MLFVQLFSGREITRYLAWKLLAGGLLLFLLAALLVLFPRLVAIPVAALCLVGAVACLAGAWRAFLAARKMDRARGYQDAEFHDLP